jgi:hypothetical protein
MAYLTYGCCWTLLLVFAASAATKLRGAGSFAAFRAAFAAMAPAARRFAGPVAAVVVAAELAVVVLLAAPAAAPVGLAVAAILLGAFTTAMATAVRRGSRTPCRCFGASSTPIGRRHLARNGALLAVAATGLLGWTSGPGATTPAGLAVTALTSAVLAALTVSFDSLVDLFASPARPHSEGVPS